MVLLTTFRVCKPVLSVAVLMRLMPNVVIPPFSAGCLWKWMSTSIGILNVNYKNQPLVEDFDSGFFPSPGQIVLMGRTGGANEVHHIDNLTLKTELADVPVITGLQATADGFSVTFRDVG